MANDLNFPSPEPFGLESFAEFLPKRDPILGEDPGSFGGFHYGMMRSLTPFTPYECVLAENLIAIEWELLQHRRMRDAGLRRKIREEVRSAVMDRERGKHKADIDSAWEEFIEAGGDEDEWEDPFEFDEVAAEDAAVILAARTISPNRDIQAEACRKLFELGIAPVDLMSRAYRDDCNSDYGHDAKMRELERRRREVKRDYDALQRTRPVDAEIIEG